MNEGPLTPRQKDVAVLIGKGLGRKAAAVRLGVSEKTVEKALDSVSFHGWKGGILQRLGFNDPARLAHFCIVAGWIQLGETEET